MSGYVVLDHHHDKDAGVYRLTIGTPVEVTRAVVDDNGEPVLEPVPMLGSDGEPMRDVDGKEIVVFGGQRYETTVEHEPAGDYVFADDDEEWEGKSPEQIAKVQRQRVRKALAEREQEAAEQRAKVENRTQLPGVNDEL